MIAKGVGDLKGNGQRAKDQHIKGERGERNPDREMQAQVRLEGKAERKIAEIHVSSQEVA